MCQLQLRAAVPFGDDAVGQDLAQFDALLVEAVDCPDHTLGKGAVLVRQKPIMPQGTSFVP